MIGSCTIVMIRATTLAAALSLITPSAFAQIPKPPLPGGAPTSGFAVAVITEGIDYTNRTVAARLARDGEGEVIAYDAVDDDRRPFARDAVASQLIASAPFLIVPIRIARDSPQAWQRAFAFLRQSPARVAVILAEPSITSIDAMHAEMIATPAHLLIVPASARPKLTASHVLTVAALHTPGMQPLQTTATADLLLAPPAATREAPPSDRPRSSAEAAIDAANLMSCINVTRARKPADVIALILAKAAHATRQETPLLAICPHNPH